MINYYIKELIFFLSIVGIDILLLLYDKPFQACAPISPFPSKVNCPEGPSTICSVWWLARDTSCIL